MKNYCNKSLGLLIIRFLIGWLFLYAGIMKVPGAEQMAPFIGGAAQAVGLTFFSATAWFWIVTISEIVIGVLFIVGLFTRLASIIAIIIMLVAMNTLGRSWMQIQVPFILFVIAVAFFTSGPGKYSLSAWGNCTRWICGLGTTKSSSMSPAKAAPKMMTPSAKPAKKIVFKKKK